MKEKVQQIPDAVDNYFNHYDFVQQLKAELREAEQGRLEAEAELIAHLRGQGFNSVKRLERSISLSTRTYPKFEDFDSLQGWVDAQDEPRSEYMEEVFKKDVFGAIVKEAQKQFPGEEDKYLPPGLSMYTKTVVTVRKARSARTDNGSARSKLKRIAEEM